MLERLSRGKRNFALVLLGGLVLWFAWSIRSVLTPLIIGYLAAFILHPMVERVQLLGFARRTAVNLVFATGFLLTTGIGFGLVMQTRALVLDVAQGDAEEDDRAQEESSVVERRANDDAAAPAGQRPEDGQTAEGNPSDVMPSVAESGASAEVEGRSKLLLPPDPRAARSARSHEAGPLPRWYVRLQQRVDDFEGRWNGWFGTNWRFALPDLSNIQDAVQGYVKENQDEFGTAGVRAAGRMLALVGQFFGGLIAFIGLLILVPLYTYYLLFELERLHSFVARYIPKAERQRLSHVASQIGVVIASFFRGRLSVCVGKGLVLSLGLWIAGIDYALLFGMLSGLLSLIPFVGAMAGFLLASLFGIVEHGVIGALIRTGPVFLAGELIEGYVLIPKILGDSLGLHPLVVIFALFAGGAAFGTLGILIALPLTASIVILVRELVLPAMQRMADEDPKQRAT